jgi:general secretion pathway protein G
MIPAPETPIRAVGPEEGSTVAMHEDRRQSGFTLIELMTVIAIIGILVGVAVPQYKNAIISAKEAVLIEDLRRMQDAIEQHNADTGQYPQTLQDIVDKGYLKSLPRDPIQPDAEWVGVPCPAAPSSEAGAEAQSPGICSVRSGAEGTSLNFGGKPYSELDI